MPTHTHLGRHKAKARYVMTDPKKDACEPIDNKPGRANNPAKRRDSGSSRNTSLTCEKSLKSSASFSTKGPQRPSREDCAASTHRTGHTEQRRHETALINRAAYCS